MTLHDRIKALAPEDVEPLVATLFGSAPAVHPRVAHNSSVWQSSSGGLHVIPIDSSAPRCTLDHFSLAFSRARADAIVITGKILRDEPALSYEPTAMGLWGAALQRWRTDVLGLRKPPWLLVLTGGRALDPQHPALRAYVRPIIFTSDRSAARYLADCPHPVVASDKPSLRTAIEHLRKSRRCASIAIEAGPSTALQLYDEPRLVDELLLSVLQPSQEHAPRGPAFLDLQRLEATHASTRGPVHEDQAGSWEFRRFSRRT